MIRTGSSPDIGSVTLNSNLDLSIVWEDGVTTICSVSTELLLAYYKKVRLDHRFLFISNITTFSTSSFVLFSLSFCSMGKNRPAFNGVFNKILISSEPWCCKTSFKYAALYPIVKGSPS